MHNNLQAVLDNVLDLSKQLILCLDRENACLITRKYDQLVDNAQQKQQLVDELDALDQQRQAIELVAKAEKLDPLHAGIKANLASILYWAGDDHGAIAQPGHRDPAFSS